ncbi:MAG: bifunctional precorrin-2 dehydrogenase/sirohydrochlorin ferrochelatase [Deltaproteobacteria bacterium]
MKAKEALRYQPIALRLRGHRVLVVGGGLVAERKITGLLASRARVRVVAPRATQTVRRLAAAKRLEWRRRRVRSDDLGGVDVVIAATNDTQSNERVSAWARAARTWVNVVDDQRLSTFITPAVVRCRQGIVAVYTDGRDPRLSRDLKNYLNENWDDFLSYRHRSQGHAA